MPWAAFIPSLTPSLPVLTESSRPRKKTNQAGLLVACPPFVSEAPSFMSFLGLLPKSLDTSGGLRGIGCTLEPLCQLGRRGRQQEGGEELQPSLFYLIKEKGNVVKDLTLECPEPLGQEKGSLWPPQTGSATSP